MERFDNFYLLLPALVARFHPQVYLEIGVNEGQSALLVAKCAQPYLREMILADTWGGYYGGSGRGTHDHVAALLSKVYQGKVTWLDGDSAQTLPTLKPSTVDLAVVDGDHSAKGCDADMENSWRALKPGGVMVVDDLWHPVHPWLQDVFDQFAARHPCEVLQPEELGVLRKPV